MFDSIKNALSGEQDNNTTTEEMQDMTVTSENARLEVSEPNGSAISEAPEELAKEPTTNENGVVELGSYDRDTQVAELQEDTIDVSVAAARKSSLLTDSEVEEIEKQRLTPEEEQSIKAVEAVLADSSNDITNRSQLWRKCLIDEGKLEEKPNPEDMTEAEKEQAVLDSMSGDYDPQVKENKQVSDMTGQEFKSLMQEATNPQEEELEEDESPNEKEGEEEEIEINANIQASELASRAWQNRNDVFGDLAEDLKTQSELNKELDGEVEITSLSDGFVQVVTSDDSLSASLQRVANKSGGKCRKTDNGVMVAELSEGDIENYA